MAAKHLVHTSLSWTILKFTVFSTHCNAANASINLAVINDIPNSSSNQELKSKLDPLLNNDQLIYSLLAKLVNMNKLVKSRVSLTFI